MPLAITVPDSYVAVGQIAARSTSAAAARCSRTSFSRRGVIQGVVFDDFNGNGVQDADEAGVGGAVVSQSGGVTATTSARRQLPLRQCGAGKLHGAG